MIWGLSSLRGCNGLETTEDKEAMLTVFFEVLNANYRLLKQKEKAREDAKPEIVDNERGR